MIRLSIILLVLFIIQDINAQKSYIRNGSFEEMDEKDESNLSYHPVKYWSKYKIDNVNQFIYKKRINHSVLSCPQGLNENSIDIKKISGKYSAYVGAKNIEISPSYQNRDYKFEIDYIYNYIRPLKKGKNYTLSFYAHIYQEKYKNYFFDRFDENGKKIYSKCDTCFCDTLTNDSLELTLLFTNVLPEGRLYQPQEEDVFIDTLLQNCCEEGKTFSFDFFLDQRFKYLVVGYLPRKEKLGRRVCDYFFEAAFDDFELVCKQK